jgi:hypothetical protein
LLLPPPPITFLMVRPLLLLKTSIIMSQIKPGFHMVVKVESRSFSTASI